MLTDRSITDTHTTGPGAVIVEKRLSSTILRTCLEGQNSYVKQYLSGDWDSSIDTVRARCAREAQTIERLKSVDIFHGRLGRISLVGWDAETPSLSTEEVSGRPLGEDLISNNIATWPTLFGVYLSGKWLHGFQSLPLEAGEGERIGQHNPVNLREYCEIRLNKVQSLGYKWMTNHRKERVLNTVSQLISQFPDQDRKKVWAHGDYGPGNVLWDGHTLTAIDFAMACSEAPLLDVTYFIHRMEMLAVYFPWRRWPLELWRRAFLRGYGRPDAEQSAMYRALMIRHTICRLQTYVRRPPNSLKQRLHNKWVRGCIRRSLEHLTSSAAF